MNQLYYGDNLKILQKYIEDESVDLIYLDPPFNSRRAYNVIFKDKTGKDEAAQIHAFEDTWQWTRDAQDAYDDIMEGTSPIALKKVMMAFRTDIFCILHDTTSDHIVAQWYNHAGKLSIFRCRFINIERC